MAKRRQLKGIAFSVSFGKDHHGIGITGDYTGDPLIASAALNLLNRSLDKHARETHLISASMH